MQLDYRRASDYALDLVAKDGYKAVTFDMQDGFVQHYFERVRLFSPGLNLDGILPVQLRLNLSNYQAHIRSQPDFEHVDYIQVGYPLVCWPHSFVSAFTVHTYESPRV